MTKDKSAHRASRTMFLIGFGLLGLCFLALAVSRYITWHELRKEREELAAAGCVVKHRRYSGARLGKSYEYIVDYECRDGPRTKITYER